MAASSILDKYSQATYTITVNSLAASATVGRQSTMVDNTTTRFTLASSWPIITTGTSPGNSKPVFIYGLSSDGGGTPRRNDAAGASDAGLTVVNAPLIGTLSTKASGSATNDVLQTRCDFYSPQSAFGVAVVQNTASALNASGNSVTYVGLVLEAQ